MRRRGRRISAGGIDTSRKSWAHHEMSFFWMMLQTLFIFGGDLLPVDPKLEHSMGHKISPAPHSRCSRRVKPKVSPAASTGCSLWLFPGSKEWATTTPAVLGGAATLSQPLDGEQNPSDLQSCTSVTCNEAALASKASAATLSKEILFCFPPESPKLPWNIICVIFLPCYPFPIFALCLAQRCHQTPQKPHLKQFAQAKISPVPAQLHWILQEKLEHHHTLRKDGKVSPGFLLFMTMSGTKWAHWRGIPARNCRDRTRRWVKTEREKI